MNDEHARKKLEIMHDEMKRYAERLNSMDESLKNYWNRMNDLERALTEKKTNWSKASETIVKIFNEAIVTIKKVEDELNNRTRLMQSTLDGIKTRLDQVERNIGGMIHVEWFTNWANKNMMPIRKRLDMLSSQLDQTQHVHGDEKQLSSFYQGKVDGLQLKLDSSIGQINDWVPKRIKGVEQEIQKIQDGASIQFEEMRKSLHMHDESEHPSYAHVRRIKIRLDLIEENIVAQNNEMHRNAEEIGNFNVKIASLTESIANLQDNRDFLIQQIDPKESYLWQTIRKLVENQEQLIKYTQHLWTKDNKDRNRAQNKQAFLNEFHTI